MRHLAAFVVAAVLTASGSALAQGADSGYVERGPRFLLASTTSTTPVRVDVARTPVLRRRISLDLHGVPLSAALREVSEQAGVQLAFSNAVLPPDRRVELRVDNITVAAALTELLLDAEVDILFSRDGRGVLVRRQEGMTQAGTVVGRVTDAKTETALAGATVVVEGTTRSVTTGNDGRYRIEGVAAGTYTVRARYIGYAPGAVSVTVSADQEATADFELEKSVQRLDEVVTTGTIVPTEVKALPTPISIITADDIQQQNLARVDQIFRGMVPGTIAWDQGQNDYYSTIQVRGTNSIYASPTIKTYIDGIEVANPQFIATIDPNSIARVEVTRGPQGSTIYGSDASGGVMQIFTKKGSASIRPEVQGKVALGAVDGRYSKGLGVPLRQDYALSVTGGGDKYGYNVGGSYVRTGEWVPGYDSRTPSLFAGGHLTQGPLTAELTARYNVKSYASVFSPSLSKFQYYSKPSYLTERTAQSTYSLLLTYQTSPQWQQQLTLGVDQLDDNYYNTRPRLTTPADTLLQFSNTGLVKASLRYNTSYHLGLTPAISSVITAGFEHYNYNGFFAYVGDATRTTGTVDGTPFTYRERFGNTGFFSQVQVAVRNAFFLTGGIRGEHNDNFGDTYGTAWSPRIGASLVRPIGTLSVKLRTGYGNAIKGVFPFYKDANRNAYTDQRANPGLGPERQKGWDAGIDLYAGSRASLGLSYYDQDAIDLIDAVYLDASVSPPVSQFQNVGRIRNRGWEFEGTLALGRLGIAGTYSRTTSTVKTLSPTYTGDLQVGDPMLYNPRHSAGVQLTYPFTSGTILGTAVTYIGRWTGTDLLALFGYYFGGDPYRGSGRAYWTTYPSVTKVNLSLSQRLTQRTTGFVQVDNLTNNTAFEQNNLNIPMGRVTTLGIRFHP